MRDSFMYIFDVTLEPPFIAVLYVTFITGLRDYFYLLWTGAALVGVIILTLQHDWIWMLLETGNLALAVVLWWWSRRRRKRAPKAYGAKTLALLASLVRKAREAARPRVVLRPVPGGV